MTSPGDARESVDGMVAADIPDPAQNHVPDHTIDITRETCPMTFVRVRLALDRLSSGQLLLVLLKGDEPLRNVPRTAAEQGHTVLGLDEVEGISRLLLRRK
jgi:TusA-related sulfurtransferase